MLFQVHSNSQFAKRSKPLSNILSVSWPQSIAPAAVNCMYSTARLGCGSCRSIFLIIFSQLLLQDADLALQRDNFILCSTEFAGEVCQLSGSVGLPLFSNITPALCLQSITRQASHFKLHVAIGQLLSTEHLTHHVAHSMCGALVEDHQTCHACFCYTVNVYQARLLICSSLLAALTCCSPVSSCRTRAAGPAGPVSTSKWLFMLAAAALALDSSADV